MIVFPTHKLKNKANNFRTQPPHGPFFCHVTSISSVCAILLCLISFPSLYSFFYYLLPLFPFTLSLYLFTTPHNLSFTLAHTSFALLLLAFKEQQIQQTLPSPHPIL